MKQINLFAIISVFCSVMNINAQSINDLDFLIGEWDITETILPGTEKAYQENGKRVCSYYLNNSFIKCESKTVSSRTNKERHYVYLINYDKKENCFWATGLAHDFPLHSRHKWFLDKENKLIRAITPKNVNGDRFFRGTISFKDKNKVLWNGWSSKYLGEKEWRHIFEDITVRIK